MMVQIRRMMTTKEPASVVDNTVNGAEILRRYDLVEAESVLFTNIIESVNVKTFESSGS